MYGSKAAICGCSGVAGFLCLSYMAFAWAALSKGLSYVRRVDAAGIVDFALITAIVSQMVR